MPLIPGQLLNNRYRIVKLLGLRLLRLVAIIAVSILLVGCHPVDRTATQITLTETGVVTPMPTSTVTPIATTTPTGTPTPSLTPAPFFTATPALGIGSTQISAHDGMVMVYIPAGDFQMGASDSDTNANSDEKPHHKVFLNSFWMYQTEVTNAQYALCVKDNVCEAPQYVRSITRSHYYDDPQFNNYPVIWASWNDASNYCQWAEGRLPTEAEWEKAGRGGLEGKLYPWGDEAPVCDQQVKNGANYASCSMEDTTPTGYFQPNDYGLYDMAGNVWEWVSDWYGASYYKTFLSDSSPTDPIGPHSGYYRVLRGGSWHAGAQDLRVSLRPWNDPLILSYYYYVIGFRCAR